ncbi:uncharacterized protein FTOL_03650 [Fusarium torulosum]|uniref:Uncharacterized protein n=1 Tax=Fusarium torulosum TaxID=33205 RepID=A0AAE8SFH3_9HYPO|nr:uncharacterized protein FTOL_03650 [Fusarium torulosum]
MSWPPYDFQDMDESMTFEQVMGSSQPSLVSLGVDLYNLLENDVNEGFSQTFFPSQDAHGFETFNMFQDSVSPDNQSHFLNTGWIEDDGLLLTVPELAVPDETGPSQFTSERSPLQYEPLVDPQMDTSTIL